MEPKPQCDFCEFLSCMKMVTKDGERTSAQ